MRRYNFTNPLFLSKIYSMLRRFFIILSLFVLTTCDDGDIITVELVFDQELERCTNDNESYLIYDLRQDPNESLSLIIPRNDTNDLLFSEPTASGISTEFAINGSTVRFLYRTYNRAVVSSGTDQELCDVIPPSDLVIVEDYEATAGSAFVTVTIDDDDGDGIPSDLEGRGDADENGNFPNALNSDGDEFPDYLDEDDDNDNVKTINEIDSSDIDGDGDPTTNPLDTDGDLIPDYLDTDDDGDMVLTIQEDANGDKDPRNDQNTNSAGDLVPHYLNILEVTNYGSPGFTENNSYTRTVLTNFVINDVNLEILSAEIINLGTLTTVFTVNQ
ncbi:hypothetical protein [Winogradskyella sp. PE311]|uniref:hypothetical protein n=1 Tax=Winogradskyella sp. PE311 TaxID=3366943 RepID=UPI00398189EA